MAKLISLARINDTHKEAMSIFDNHTWTSPAGGWLSPTTSGRWNQLPMGIYIEPTTGQERIAELRGLVFESCSVNETELLTLTDWEPQVTGL